MKNRMSLYRPFISLKDKFLIFRNNPIDYIESISLSIRKLYDRKSENRYNIVDDMGGYKYLNHFRVDSLIKVQKTKPKSQEEGKHSEVPKYTMKYLNKIVQLCKEENVKLIFIRSPQHRLYPNLSNEKEFQEIRKTMFADVDFIDINDFDLDDDDFGDFEHLNYLGARKVSKWFDEFVIDSIAKIGGI